MLCLRFFDPTTLFVRRGSVVPKKRKESFTITNGVIETKKESASGGLLVSFEFTFKLEYAYYHC